MHRCKRREGSRITGVGTGEIGNWGADQYLWWVLGLVAGVGRL